MQKKNSRLESNGQDNLSKLAEIWAVFHMMEELVHRADTEKLRDTGYQHLVGDIKRAYALLISEWLEYMKHLKESYPYLFSLAVRTSNFDQNASPEVR